MAYQYRGTRLIKDEPAPEQTRKSEPAAYVGQHGTGGGYTMHFRAGDRGDQICQPCRDARAAHRRAARAAKGLKPGRKPIYGTGCGSPAGYTAHLRADTRPCDPCRLAYNARKLQYIHERKAAA